MGAPAAMIAFMGDTLTLSPASVSDSRISPDVAEASWRLDADGQVYIARAGVAGGAFQAQYAWVSPASNAPNYECSWTAGTGTVDTTPVAAGSYAALTSDRTWTETSAAGFQTADFTARLRRVGGTVDVKTALVELSAESSP